MKLCLIERILGTAFALHVENDHLIEKLHDENIQKELAQNKLIENQQQLEETVELRTKELSEANESLIDEINERRRIESNLKHIAHHDALTNLPNRLLLDARLNHALERAKRSDQHVAVLFIDLDHFKTINDSLGHDVGDQLLVSISQRLLNCVREGDTVARLGGDEFAVLCQDCSLEEATAVAERLRTSVRQSIRVGDLDVVAEDPVVADLQVGDPRALALALALLGDNEVRDQLLDELHAAAGDVIDTSDEGTDVGGPRFGSE